MPDLTTMHLKCLLDQATPGPWEYKLEDGYIMGDLVEILNGWIQTADGKTVLGTGLEINDEQELRNLALAATAPELAEEVIRFREELIDWANDEARAHNALVKRAQEAGGAGIVSTHKTIYNRIWEILGETND